jgi:predicted lipoprotein with Yx(FWY)xxD motif
MAAAGASASGDWTIVTRDDGSKQWAYRASRCTTGSATPSPAIRTGDGFNNAWRLARP